jgi:hypothetical protein
VPIGTGPIGWAIERDGKTWRTGPRLEVLGAWLDAYLAGASSYDADDIAKVIERRPRPSYEERLAVFNATGRPEPGAEVGPHCFMAVRPNRRRPNRTGKGLHPIHR